MSFKYSLTLALGIALALPLSRVLAADNPTTAPSGPSASFKIGTASIEKIFDNLEEKRQIEASLKDRQNAVKLQADDMRKNIAGLTADLQLVKQDSSDYTQKNDQLVEAKIKLEVLLQVQNANIEHTYKAQLVHVFREIQDAVGNVAKQEGYNLIIDAVTPDLPGEGDLDNIQPDQLSLLINQRTVLYDDLTNDISHDVWVQMNNDFARSK